MLYQRQIRKDDDVANWNAEDMLEAIKEGTAQDTEKRKADGIPLLLIKGWEESIAPWA